jgi:cysteine desulfurase/selenocysteine lyase
MDVQQIRKEFPILSRTVHGKPLVYLDSAATAQKPRGVIEAEARFYSDTNSNVSRGVYELSEEATEAYEGARARVGRFLHAPDPSEIIFVRGTTEALNLLAHGLGRSRLHRGDRVVATVSDHHSNLVPWHMLREERGTTLELVDVDDEGHLRVDEYDRWLDGTTKVVTLPHISNVLGAINPIREIADRAHAAGAVVVVDAAQSAPHIPIDVVALGADALAFSGHKTLGPTGIGALWARTELLHEMPPYMGGGSMIEQVHADRVTYREAPAKFEAGTPNIAGAIGLSAALDFLERIGWDDLARHERSLQTRMFQDAESRFGTKIRIYGPRDPNEREAVFSFSMKGIHPHDIASILDAEGIAIRAGHHCSQPLMERYAVGAMSRASPYLYNTLDEVDRLFDALEKVAKVFA